MVSHWAFVSPVSSNRNASTSRQQLDGSPEHTQLASIVQLALQPSGGSPDWLPSSHSSPASMIPFPQHAGSSAPLMQLPAMQASPAVHVLSSLHAVPSVFAGFEQSPVAELQVSTSWH